MLVVLAFPESGFLDVSAGRGPPADHQHGSGGAGVTGFYPAPERRLHGQARDTCLIR
jgi:hypothetical protein